MVKSWKQNIFDYHTCHIDVIIAKYKLENNSSIVNLSFDLVHNFA